MTFKSGIDAACKSYSLEGRHFVNGLHNFHQTAAGQLFEHVQYSECAVVHIQRAVPATGGLGRYTSHIDKPVYKIFFSTVNFFAFLGQKLPKY